MSAAKPVKPRSRKPKNPVWLEQGQRLAATRAALGFPSAAALWDHLQRKLDIQESAVRNYESGTREISPAFAMVLADELGLTLDWIYRGIPTALPQAIYQKITSGRPIKEPLENAEKHRIRG